MSSEPTKKFCTFCMNAGKDKEECYGHFPGEDCPTLKETVCRKCKQTGHTPTHCKTLWCKFCRNYGHKVEECLELKAKKEVDKDKYCSFCGEQGHTYNRCPSPYRRENRRLYHDN